MRSIRNILYCLAGLLCSQSVHAAVIFSNLTDTVDAGNGSTVMTAVSTSVGSSATSITNFVIVLEKTNGSAPLVAQVCADNAGAPNMASCQVFTTTDAIPNFLTNISFSGTYAAGANARVWIVLSISAGQYGYHISAQSARGVWTSSDSGATWSNLFPTEEMLYSISGNTAPTASSVTISGTPQIGGTLTGSFAYADADGDAQGASTFRWMEGSSADGSNKHAFSGATGPTYSPVAADGGSYFFFCATPVALSGMLTGTEVCSSGLQFVLVPNTTSPTAVPGIGPNPLTPLDLNSGYGPTLTGCLMTTIRQLLGPDAVYQGQVSGGGNRIMQGGKIISFYALRAGGDNSESSGIHLLASNALNVGTSCGNLNVAPALYNPAEFGAMLTGIGLSASINATGVITVTGNGSVYVARPDYFVSPGQTPGTGLQLGSDGLYRFTDSAGNSQILRPAFLSTEALQAGAGAGLGGSLVIQIDGSALFTQLGGTQSLLRPDLVLGAIPTAFASSNWWNDGANHYRFPVGLASQGLTMTAN